MSEFLLPQTPLLELVLRGSILYFAILILMRIMPRRTGGELEMMDLIFIILIAEAASHAMGDYTSVTDGLILIVTFMAWNFSINFLSYHIPLIERLVTSPPIQVVKNGRLLQRNMRREYLTKDELMDHLRQQGIEKLEDVKAAYIEGEGKITVIGRAKQ